MTDIKKVLVRFPAELVDMIDAEIPAGMSRNDRIVQLVAVGLAEDQIAAEALKFARGLEDVRATIRQPRAGGPGPRRPLTQGPIPKGGKR